MERHNWLVHKIALTKNQQAAQKYAKGIVLDIGCGEKPYESVFAPYVEKHIGLDHQDTLHSLSKVDIVATAYDTTLPDESVDTIL